MIDFMTALPARIIDGVAALAGWSWDHRWYAPLAVLVVGGLGVLLAGANRKDRQVRDLWKRR